MQHKSLHMLCLGQSSQNRPANVPRSLMRRLVIVLVTTGLSVLQPSSSVLGVTGKTRTSFHVFDGLGLFEFGILSDVNASSNGPHPCTYLMAVAALIKGAAVLSRQVPSTQSEVQQVMIVFTDRRLRREE